MSKIDRDRIPADLTWVAERLEAERPAATSLELDSMQLQARARAARTARSQAKGSFLKSRVAIAAILMLGLFTGGTGTTLALTDGGGDAAQVQYPDETPRAASEILGKSQERAPSGGGAPGEGGTLGEGGGQAGGSSSGAVQGTRQVVATQSGDSLPFTGLAAVPLILLGFALVGAGAMLYRSAREPTGS